MSIKNKFLLIILCGVLAPLSITGVTVYIYTRGHIQEIVQEALTTTGQTTVTAIESYIRERSKEMDVLANSRVFQTTDGKAQQERMAVYSRNFDAFNAFVFFTPEGIPLATHGNIIHHGGQAPTQLFEHWHQAARQGVRLVDVHPESGAQFRRFIVFLRTVRDVETQAVSGYLAAQLPMDKVINLFDGITFGQTGRVTLFNAQGILIGHFDRSRVGYDMRRYPVMTDPLERNQNNTGDYFLSGDGREKWGITMLLPELKAQENLKWGVILDQTTAELYRPIARIRNVTLFTGVAAVVVLMLLSLVFVRRITDALQAAIAFANTMAQGDFSRKLAIDRKDEVGVLARALNQMVDSIGRMFGDISGGVATLAASSGALGSVSDNMTAMAEGTAGKAHTVATAAEEMSANMHSVAAAMEEASTSIHTVATASDEMRATISEIAQNSQKAQQITGRAVERSRHSMQRVGELGQAASEIGKVTESIMAISAQTNLLALNATIEAARAGTAGKGFAVVANEIKELAKQTTGATDEIKAQIEGIQSSANLTIAEIREISAIIDDMDAIIATIAAAVEQQTTTTRDIADNVSQAASGIQEVNGNVAQSSTVVQEVARDIADVSTNADNMRAFSDRVRESSTEISGLADKLKTLLERFKV